MSLAYHLHSSSKHSGFTLIELLIVLMIIGVVVSLVSLNIGAKPSSAKHEAQKLQGLLELSKDDAILKGQILGWKISMENYGFYRYKDKTWQPLSADKLLRSYPLHPELEYKLMLDKAKVSYDAESLPQIVLLPDGSINDFILSIQPHDHSETYQVYSQQGKIKTLLVDEKK
jgi:general secretion pathway protein H